MSLMHRIKPAAPSAKPIVNAVAKQPLETAETGIPASEKPSRKGVGGRPKKVDALQPVTLRLRPDLIAAYQAGGDDWRARMVDALDAAKP